MGMRNEAVIGRRGETNMTEKERSVRKLGIEKATLIKLSLR